MELVVCQYFSMSVSKERSHLYPRGTWVLDMIQLTMIKTSGVVAMSPASHHFKTGLKN